MKNYLKVLSLFSTMGIATIAITAIAYTSIVLKSDTNSSNKTGSKNYSYKKDLVSEKEFSKKIKEEKKFLEQSFKNTPKTNSWKIFRRTKSIKNIQCFSHKSKVDLKNEFKTSNLKIRVLLYIQETPEPWSKEQNKNYYSSQTKKWSDQIAKKLTNLLKIEQSSFSPFVNFIFKDFNDKEKNLDILQNEKRVKVVFSYENSKVKNIQPNGHIERYAEYLRDLEIKSIERGEKNSVFESIFKNAKLDTQLYKDRYSYDSLNRMQIGIIETSVEEDNKHVAFVNGSLDTFNETSVIVKKSSDGKSSKHASLVAAIAAGKNGVNIKARIYSANERYGIQSAVEWMMKNGVKIINHSYGRIYGQTGYYPYSEDAYYIDFISRKYGIINIYSAGNQANRWRQINGELKIYPKIHGNKLSINSIVVGGLNSDSAQKSIISNFGIFNGGNNLLDQLPKPLVAIDSDGFETSIIPGMPRSRESVNGTSFSAPIVTGALSLIMRDFQYVDRPEEAMAIIASSSTKLPDDPSNKDNWEGSRLDSKVGAGRLNFINMKQAVNNLRSYTIAKTDSKLINAKQVYLNKGEKITASVAWLYNAGFSKHYNLKPNPMNWWWLLSPIAGIIAASNDLNEWKDENNAIDWKSKKIAFDNLNGSLLFTDYDLKLKYYDLTTQTWNVVAESASFGSNVELFRYKAKNKGRYKLEVIKYLDNKESYEGAPDDVLAVSYVKE